MAKIDVIIPALNEEQSIAEVLKAIDRQLVSRVVVVDNGSDDRTTSIAQMHGAITLQQPQRGYGSACQKGLEYIASSADEVLPDILVFLDADFSDDPSYLQRLTDPILNNEADLVIGSRVKAMREPGSMTFPQIFGNWLATFLIRLIWQYEYSDLGPFRAIRYSSLLDLKMEDEDFGWTVEMQIKAAHQKIRIKNVAVPYRKRVGISKISGTVKGTFMAGYKILYTIWKYWRIGKKQGD
jgi:glycosyltransferase involved in cell wall biosynthesis